MTIPTITALPTAPARTDGEALFSPRMDAFLAAMPTLATEINAATAAIPAAVAGVDYNATSTSSVLIGTGSKAFTIETGKLIQVGQFMLVASTASPQNYMYGQVTAHNSTTGALTINVTATGGAGTLAAWTISLSTSVDALPKSGGTMTGGLIHPASTTAIEPVIIPHGAAPTTPTNGSVWTTTAGIYVRVNGATLGPLISGASPAITTPTFTGTPIEDIYTITDGAAFEIDPANGSIQTITLGASRTPKGTNFVAGQSVTLSIDDGTAYALTWTDTTFGASGVKWLGAASGGGTAPTLGTTGLTWITMWKTGTQVYAALSGYTG